MKTNDWNFLRLGCAMALVGVFPWTAPLAAQAPRATTIVCPAGVPVGEVEGETVQCGVVAVPENHQQPNGAIST